MNQDLEKKDLTIRTAVGDLFIVSHKHASKEGDGWFDLDNYKLAKSNPNERYTYHILDPQVHIKPSELITNAFDVKMENGYQRMEITNERDENGKRSCSIRMFDATILTTDKPNEVKFNVASTSELLKWTEAFLDGKIRNSELVREGENVNFSTRAGRARILNAMSAEPVGPRWAK